MLSNARLEEILDLHSSEPIGDLGAIHKAMRQAADEALEDAALRVRAICHVCDGTGTIESWRDTETLRVLECEFCAKPMAAVRALKSKGAP